MQLLVATSNPHKLQELDAILGDLGVRVVGLDSLDVAVEEPVEDADTFEGNARLKAVGYAAALGRACLAEDSGLEVDGLDGAPGVYSARYAGTEGDRATRDQRNNDKLLAELAARPDADRSARFVCAMCLVDAQGKVLFETRGTYEGVIGEQPRGANGFGYDPLLYLPDVGCSSAELTPEAKNARSHRGAAARELFRWLQQNPHVTR